jgi:membrane-associated phospholipid phosphatase
MKMVAGAGATIAFAALFDRPFERHLSPHRNSASATHFRRMGDLGQLAGPAVGTLFAVQGWAAGNDKSKETAFLSYESFLWSGALCGGIKYAVGRERPSLSSDPFHFRPASGNASFPSGHTTAAFAAATVFSEQYPHWAVIIPSYAAASAVGFSRMVANQHWGSDVVAGAMLGTVVSHTLRKWHRQSKKNPDQAFILIDPSGLRWVKKF